MPYEKNDSTRSRRMCPHRLHSAEYSLGKAVPDLYKELDVTW